MKQEVANNTLQPKPLAAMVSKIFKSQDGVSTSFRALVNSVFILMLNMLTGMITARMLGPAGRGDLGAMILCAELLAFTMTFGIPSALLYNIKRNPEHAPNLYATGLFMTVLNGIGAIFLGSLIIPYWLSSYSAEVIAYAQMAVFVTPLILITFIHNAVLRARNEFHIFNRIKLLQPTAVLTFLLILMVGGWMTPLTAAMAYLLPYTPFTVWNVQRLIREYKPQFIRPFIQIKHTLRTIYQYGMRSYGIDLLGNVALFIDRIIVVGMLTPSHFGLYVVAVSLSRMVNVFQHSIVMVLFPRASGLPQEQIISMTYRVFRISNVVALLGVLILLLIAPFVLTILYGNQFEAALSTFRILVLEVMTAGAAMILSQAFMAMGRPGVVTIMEVTGLSVSIPLLFWLVPEFGITGAAGALLASAIIRLIYISVRFKWSLKAPMPKLWPNREDLVWIKQYVMDRNRNKEEV